MGEPAPVIVLSPAQVEALVDRAVERALAARGASTEASEVLTRDEAAKLLHLTPPSLVRLVRDHGLPASKIGAEWRFRRSELLVWLKNQHAPANAAPPRRLRPLKGGR